MRSSYHLPARDPLDDRVEIEIRRVLATADHTWWMCGDGRRVRQRHLSVHVAINRLRQRLRDYFIEVDRRRQIEEGSAPCDVGGVSGYPRYLKDNDRRRATGELLRGSHGWRHAFVVRRAYRLQLPRPRANTRRACRTGRSGRASRRARAPSGSGSSSSRDSEPPRAQRSRLWVGDLRRRGRVAAWSRFDAGCAYEHCLVAFNRPGWRGNCRDWSGQYGRP
jgi:hypothetical protein